jgi:hypothetical protein
MYSLSLYDVFTLSANRLTLYLIWKPIQLLESLQIVPVWSQQGIFFYATNQTLSFWVFQNYGASGKFLKEIAGLYFSNQISESVRSAFRIEKLIIPQKVLKMDLLVHFKDTAVSNFTLQ